MGHNPLEIAIHWNLLHKRPAFVGIPLQPERALKYTALPAQTIGRLELERTLQDNRAISGLQHRLKGCVQLPGPAIGLECLRCRCSGRGPYLPLFRVSHLGWNTESPPALGRPLG